MTLEKGVSQPGFHAKISIFGTAKACRFRRLFVEYRKTTMDTYLWTNRLKELYDKALDAYCSGNRRVGTYFDEPEQEWLVGIGATPMEIYDLVEDGDDIPWETALLIVAARRDYFLTVQRGEWSGKRLTLQDYPAKSAELDGIRWLPRVILKAQSKLSGEMPADLMYCCGGDRQFFRTWNIHPADFLRLVWAVDGNPEKVLEYIRQLRGAVAVR
jgi:hypothetical protein